MPIKLQVIVSWTRPPPNAQRLTPSPVVDRLVRNPQIPSDGPNRPPALMREQPASCTQACIAPEQFSTFPGLQS